MALAGSRSVPLTLRTLSTWTKTVGRLPATNGSARSTMTVTSPSALRRPVADPRRKARPVLRRLEDAELGALEHRGRVRVGEAEGALRARGAGRLRDVDVDAHVRVDRAFQRQPAECGHVHRPAGHVSRAHQHAAASRAGHLAVAERDDPVDEDQADAFRQSRRVVVGRAIDHRGGIEHGEVGHHAGRDEAAVHHADRARRQGGHLPHRVFPGERFRFPDVAAEHARERPEGAGMLPRVRRCAAVAGDRGGGVLQDLHQIGFGAEPQNRGDVALFEHTDDRFTRRGPLLAHEVDELPPRRRQEDAFGSAESRLHRRSRSPRRSARAATDP